MAARDRCGVPEHAELSYTLDEHVHRARLHRSEVTKLQNDLRLAQTSQETARREALNQAAILDQVLEGEGRTPASPTPGFLISQAEAAKEEAQEALEKEKRERRRENGFLRLAKEKAQEALEKDKSDKIKVQTFLDDTVAKNVDLASTVATLRKQMQLGDDKLHEYQQAHIRLANRKVAAELAGREPPDDPQEKIPERSYVTTPVGSGSRGGGENGRVFHMPLMARGISVDTQMASTFPGGNIGRYLYACRGRDYQTTAVFDNPDLILQYVARDPAVFMMSFWIEAGTICTKLGGT